MPWRRYATEHYVDALFDERRHQSEAAERNASEARQTAQHASDAVTRHQNEFRDALKDAQENFVQKDSSIPTDTKN